MPACLQARDLSDLPEEMPEEPGRGGGREVARLLGEDEEDEDELIEMEEDYRRKQGGGAERGCHLAGAPLAYRR